MDDFEATSYESIRQKHWYTRDEVKYLGFVTTVTAVAVGITNIHEIAEGAKHALDFTISHLTEALGRQE